MAETRPWRRRSDPARHPTEMTMRWERWIIPIVFVIVAAILCTLLVGVLPFFDTAPHPQAPAAP